MSKRLLVVRHGDTFLPGEPPRRIGARTDLPLTPRGEAQAQAVAAWLAAHDCRPDTILTGPLRRASRTAERIRDGLHAACPLLHAGWLDEVDHGPDEGRLEEEVVARIGADAIARWDRTAEPPPDWPIDRAAKIAECGAGVAALPAGTTLLATSNGTARFILLALGLAGGVASLKLRTGAIGDIAVAGGKAVLRQWNVRPGD